MAEGPPPPVPLAVAPGGTADALALAAEVAALKSAVAALAATDAAALTSLGQRRINLIWESTQAAIAVLIIGAVIAKSLLGVLSANDPLSLAMFLVIGFYYSRTNHQRVGGVAGAPPVEVGR